MTKRTRQAIEKQLTDAARKVAPFNAAGDKRILTAPEVAGLLTVAGLMHSREAGAAPVLPGVHEDPANPFIAMITADLIKVACPQQTTTFLQQFVAPIRNACVNFEINTIRRIAAFIAQMAHESICFSALNENMNYSAQRMAEVWPSRYRAVGGGPNALAVRLAREGAQAIANHTYANRLGNGGPESGDGWRFRGGGGIHLTGRNNWTAFARDMDLTLDQALEWGRTAEGAVMAGAWFWETNDINRLADTPGVTDETKAINGGTHGLAARTSKFNALVNEMLRLERVPA